MGSVEMIIKEEEFLDVTIQQHYDLRRILREWAKAFWRHHVVKCSSTCISLTNWYNLPPSVLKYVLIFIAVLGFSLIRTLIESTNLLTGLGFIAPLARPLNARSESPLGARLPARPGGGLFIVLGMIMVMGAVLTAVAALCELKRRRDRTVELSELLVPLMEEEHLDTISRVVEVKTHTTTMAGPECHGSTPALPPPYVSPQSTL